METSQKRPLRQVLLPLPFSFLSSVFFLIHPEWAGLWVDILAFLWRWTNAGIEGQQKLLSDGPLGCNWQGKICLYADASYHIFPLLRPY